MTPADLRALTDAAVRGEWRVHADPFTPEAGNSFWAICRDWPCEILCGEREEADLIVTMRRLLPRFADLWEVAEALADRLTRDHQTIDARLNAALARLREVGA